MQWDLACLACIIQQQNEKKIQLKVRAMHVHFISPHKNLCFVISIHDKYHRWLIWKLKISAELQGQISNMYSTLIFELEKELLHHSREQAKSK